jgi:hypothetical protein
VIIALVIFLIWFPILEALRDYYVFPVKLEVSKRWHSLGFVLRATTACLLLKDHWQFIPLYAFYFWIMFDLLTGVGTTAATDILLGKYSAYIKVIGLIASAIFLYKF